MITIDRRRRCYYYNLIFISICFCLLFLMKYDFSTQTFLSNSSSFDCTNDPLEHWCQDQIHLCNSSLIIFNHLFVKTHSIKLQRKFAIGKRQGGEDLKDVLNQNESDEYFHFKKDFIQLPCNISLSKELFRDSYLSSIFSSLLSYETKENFKFINEPTIAINRIDYVNFYHTITDVYTVYLLCRFFGYNPKTVHILFLDAHPKGNLDLLWTQLFHSYNRLGHMNNNSSLIYRELIWSPEQSKSELDIQQHRKQPPSYFSHFRQHILQQFDVPSERNSKYNCQKFKIFFLLRHDYIAHPRNPTGKIQRQLINETKVLNDLKEKFQNFSTIYFHTNHFEHLSIQQQLQIITQTDIFIGMHGAGLTHVIFMKANRTLIELATDDYRKQTHFEQMSSINNINYYRCLIINGHITTPQTIFDCISKQLIHMCPSL